MVQYGIEDADLFEKVEAWRKWHINATCNPIQILNLSDDPDVYQIDIIRWFREPGSSPIVWRIRIEEVKGISETYMVYKMEGIDRVAFGMFLDNILQEA